VFVKFVLMNELIIELIKKKKRIVHQNRDIYMSFTFIVMHETLSPYAMCMSNVNGRFT
jgi:hypothetical protein